MYELLDDAARGFPLGSCVRDQAENVAGWVVGWTLKEWYVVVNVIIAHGWPHESDPRYLRIVSRADVDRANGVRS